MTDPFDELFDYWRDRLNHPRAKPTEDRKRKVRARLREGYSVEDLARAIDGCARSTWHTSRGFTDLTLICRDATHVDRFASWSDSGAPIDERERFDRAWAELRAHVARHGSTAV